MLNFNNVRKLTGEMMEASFEYAEAFLQKVFDSMEFEDDYIFANVCEFRQDTFPDDSDSTGVFHNISIEISFNCTGAICVALELTSDVWDYDLPAKSVLQEVLLKNGFNKSEGTSESVTIFKRAI